MRQCSIESRESYVDKLDARKHLDFNLLRISPEYLIEVKIDFNHSSQKCFTIFNNIMVLIAVR